MTSRLLLAALGCAALLAAPARAASFDCATPADDWQRAICADPALSQLEGDVTGAYRTMQGTPWLHGLRARHEAAMAALRGAIGDPAALRRGLEARRAALYEEATWMSVNELEGTPDRRVRSQCLPLIPEEEDSSALRRRACRVAAFGALAAVDGRRYSYALYEYRPDPRGEMPHETGIVVLTAAQPGEWTVEVAERLPFASCQTPRVVQQGRESLLYLPCEEVGTAGGPIPLLYRRTGPASFRRWQPVEAESWRAMLEQRLPAGLELRGAAAFDPERMTATAPLQRATDQPCCPTGGRAEARLAIEDDRLVLRDLAIRPAQPPR